MIDLTWIPEALRAFIWVYVIAFLVAFGVALSKPATGLSKLTWSAAVLVVFGYGPVWLYLGLLDEQEQVARTRIQSDAKLAEAMALFAERCKTAGEKIVRTVDHVDGVVWMKWREKYSNHDNFADQFKLNDPYGRDCGEEECIGRLLRLTSGGALLPEEAKRHTVGYRFVETIDPADGQRYRYTASIRVTRQRTLEQREQFKRNSGGRDPGFDVFGYALDRAPIKRFEARYGVIWDDISTRQDREHWIAGSSLKVIDLQSNEVVGERIAYMVDQGQGSQAGFRSPWLFAVQTACPHFPTESSGGRHGRTLYETRAFVTRILKPTQGEQ